MQLHPASLTDAQDGLSTTQREAMASLGLVSFAYMGTPDAELAAVFARSIALLNPHAAMVGAAVAAAPSAVLDGARRADLLRHSTAGQWGEIRVLLDAGQIGSESSQYIALVAGRCHSVGTWRVLAAAGHLTAVEHALIHKCPIELFDETPKVDDFGHDYLFRRAAVEAFGATR